jgi:hypothetical protein
VPARCQCAPVLTWSRVGRWARPTSHRGGLRPPDAGPEHWVIWVMGATVDSVPMHISTLSARRGEGRSAIQCSNPTPLSPALALVRSSHAALPATVGTLLGPLRPSSHRCPGCTGPSALPGRWPLPCDCWTRTAAGRSPVCQTQSGVAAP